MSLITLTPAAAERFQSLMAEKNPKPEAVIVSIKSQGCSGFGYDIRFLEQLNNKPKMADEFVQHGITMVIDPRALPYVAGLTIDYTESMERSGFQFLNPNEASRCGCGESFSVKGEEKGVQH